MLAKLYATFRFELRQALRRKALWLLAVVFLAGTYFFYSAQAESSSPAGIWGISEIQQTGIVYVNFSWVVRIFAPVGLVGTGLALFLTLYLAGRSRERLLDQMVFTKPVSTLQLQLGRFSAIAALCFGLSLMPMGAILYYYAKHRYYPWAWSDFTLLWALGLAWPMGVAAAIACWARSVFRGALAASAFSLIPLVLLHASDPFCSLSPFWFLENLTNLYWLPLGFDFPSGQLVHHLLGSALLALTLLVGGSYYLRRRAPNRPPGPAGGRRSLDVPTLRQLIQNLPPDRAVGRDAGLTLALLSLGLAAILTAGWIERFQSRSAWNTWDRQWQELARQYPPAHPLEGTVQDYLGPAPSAKIRVTHYDLDLRVEPSGKHPLAGQCGILLINEGPRAATEFPLLLNPGLKVHTVQERPASGDAPPSAQEGGQSDWQPADFRQTLNQLWLSPSSPIPPGSQRRFQIGYQGSLVLSRSSEGAFLESQARLDSPVWALDEKHLYYPIAVSLASPDSGKVDLQPGYFSATMRVSLPGQTDTLAFAAGRSEGSTITATFPQNRMTVLGGPFRESRRTVEGVPVRLLTLPGHEAIGQVYLEDVEWMLRDTFLHLGGFPYPELVLYDSVMAPSYQPPGPGLLPIQLDPLLHWKTTRDTFSRRFKRRINRSRYFLYVGLFEADRLQDTIVQSCFQDSVHPIGPLAPLLSRHLPEYVRWAVRPATRRARRFTRQYDVDVNQKPLYRKPLRQMMAGNTHGVVLGNKATAFFHMLRYLLGEDQWEQLLQTYLSRYRFAEVRLIDFRRLAGEIAGEDLEWFFTQWLDQPALPEYRITRAQGQMYDDPQTLGMDYHVSIEIINEGTGQMRVPLYLKTEGDEIIEPVMLHTGQRREVRFDVPDRPLFTSVDPEGWILQAKHYYEKGKVGRMEQPVEILPPRQARQEAGAEEPSP